MYREVVLSTLLVLGTLLSENYGSFQACRWKTYEEPGDINFGVIISMRAREPNGTCGEVSYGSIQALLAIKYALQKLNGRSLASNQSFIPGVKLGVSVFDDCGNDKYARASALSMVRSHFPANLIDCDQQSSPIFGGILGPTRSPSATAVSGVLDGTGIPLIGSTITLSELSNKTKYPNILRTAVSDEKQSKAIISVVKRLGWSVIAILHTTDNYGSDLSSSVQRLAKQNQICVLRVLSVEDLRNLNYATRILLDVQKGTTANSLGVVYLGQNELVRNLMNTLRTEYSDNPEGISNLKWILPDSVGTNADIVNGFNAPSERDHLRSVWSISPKSVPLVEFGEFVQSKIAAAMDGSINSTNYWLADFVLNSCQSVLPSQGCTKFRQNNYIPAYIHSVYTMSVAVKEIHEELCKGVSGVCDALKRKNTLELLSYVRKVSLAYANMDAHHTIPELATSKASVSFDENGDIKQTDGEALYFINKFSGDEFIKMGSYHENGSLQLNTETLSSSKCGDTCQGCVDNPKFMYLPGDILLAGFFSLHWSPSINNPFGCGTFRTAVHTIIPVEAFFYTIKKMRIETGKNFGAILFDDCYSFIKADSIVTKFFSGATELVDPNTGEVIDLTKVVGVIGSESSAVTLPLVEIFNRLRLPVISPASTTPDLDDKVLYPFSLRTSISDRRSVEVILAVVKHFGWTYINLIYSNNNYGYKAMLLVREKAEAENICVADPIPIEITPNEKDLTAIVKTLNTNGARVIVYIGLEEDTKAFQNVIKYQNIDLVFLALEDWAVSLQPQKGAELVTAGSMVVLPEPPHLPWKDFPDYLVDRKPEWTKTSLWFDRFWQSHFQCNLPGRFENRYSNDCRSDLRIELSTAQSWAGQFRIGNTINAVASMIKGVVKAHKSFCLTGSEFACRTYKENPSNVTGYIREISLGSGSESYRPYRDDGNGNLEFSVHNLQRLPNGSYRYVKVGQFDPLSSRLSMMGNNPVKLYEKGKVVENIDGACTVADICKACVSHKASHNSSPDSDPTNDSAIQVAILVIVILIVIVLVVFLLIFLLRQKLDKDAANKDRAGESQQTSGPVANPHTETNSFPMFQNPASNSNSTYFSGTLQTQNVRREQNNPAVNEAHYLHASSQMSQPSRQENLPNGAGGPGQETRLKTTGPHHRAGASEPFYLQLQHSDRTTPKVVNNNRSSQSNSYVPMLPNLDTHPMRTRRQQLPNEQRIGPTSPVGDPHITQPKVAMDNTDRADIESQQSDYVNFKRNVTADVGADTHTELEAIERRTPNQTANMPHNHGLPTEPAVTSSTTSSSSVPSRVSSTPLSPNRTNSSGSTPNSNPFSAASNTSGEETCV